MQQKREVLSEFPDLPEGTLVKSLTYKDYEDLTGGSNLSCQCGWKGPFLETAVLQFQNRKGDRLSTLYLCRKSLHILASVIHNPPIAFEEQREVYDRKREK